MTTRAQEYLLDLAHEHWDRGEPIPLDLFARLAQEGLDVEGLEAKHKKEH